MSDLQLQMTEQDSKVKLSWMGPVSRAYCVDRERLNEASRGVREVLQDIASEYANAGASYTGRLPALAYAGERLKTALFDSSDASDSAEEVFEFLDSLKPYTLLSIYSDSTAHVPWNFVFSKDPLVLAPATGALSDFDLFWSNRFKIRVRYHQAALPPKQPIHRSNVKMLLALHLQHFKKANKALASDPELDAKIDKLLGREVGATYDWQDCRRKWRDLRSDSIFYIFAHSNGRKLSLKEGMSMGPVPDTDAYELDPNGFSAFFKKDRNNMTNTLCFINGCRTADGDWGNGFLSVTSTRGFQGFIGSEAEIPNDCAARYAVEFLTELLEEGSSVDRAYERSRKRCFPMSLWYSCYAYPGFRLSAD